ncbi:hypothetical protein GCM10008968_39040 [Bacillus horti]
MTDKKVVVIGHTALNDRVMEWLTPLELEVTCVSIDQLQLRITDQEVMNVEHILDHKTATKITQSDFIFDTLTGPTETKRQMIKWLMLHKQEQAPLLTSILHHTATEISSWAEHAPEIIGFHPLHFERLKMIELAPSLQHDPAILGGVQCQLTEWGKKVQLIQDQVGGVFPRSIALLINEASYALQEKVTTAESIDLAMKKGTHYPLGPLEWGDQIGLDHIHWILEGLFRELGDERYRSSASLKKKVYAQQIGIVAGRGFYEYGA